MMTGFNLEMGAWPVISSGLVQGFGIGFVMLPMNLIAFATLAPYLRTDGASLYSLSRNIGGSIAISLMTSLIAYNVQVSHSDLATHVTTLDLPTFNVNLIIGAVTSMIDAEVNRQALMIAYLDDFWIMAWAVMLVVPLVIFMRVGKRGEAPPVIMGE
jgi:DHA2 family multidrug resistance protein